MDAVLEAEARADVAGQIERARRALVADELIPYLGPGLIDLEGAAAPASPEAVAAALNGRAPAPARIRTNMWSVAQFIESQRHRKTLQAFMADIFSAPVAPSSLQRFLASLPLSLIVDVWYDDALAQALREAGRDDFVEIQGVARSGFVDLWTRAYDSAGRECPPDAALSARTVLYSPHGGARPANNFLVSDSDYVETLTEIDIQSPIPEAVKGRRSARGFLFLGCRFHDQMLRTYARQIMKRSDGPRLAVMEASAMTRNEFKFLAEQRIELIDAPLADAARGLVG